MSTTHYQGRNLDLHKLKDVVENYFRSRKFATQTKSGERDHIVQAMKEGTLRAMAGASRAYTITISGEPNNLSISIAKGKWASNIAAVGIGTLLSGGLLLIPAGFAAGRSKQIESEFIAWLDDMIRFSPDAIKVVEKDIQSSGKNDSITKAKLTCEASIPSEEKYTCTDDTNSPKQSNSFKEDILTEKNCKHCAMKIPNDANVCPLCEKGQGVSLGMKILCGFLVLLTLSVIARLIGPVSPSESSKQYSEKRMFVKSLDEVVYKDFGGLFDKVEMDGMSRVKITLDMRDPFAYDIAINMGPKFKEAGFDILRIKDKNSNRYDDIKLY